MSGVEHIIPGAPSPEWWDRMWEKPSFRWCEDFHPVVPEGFDKLWGCYRQKGHTGRHMGLVEVYGDMTKDAWVIWS